ncbi:transcriptional regulator [Carnobacterium maltaromaticum]|uniref:ArpU family phage packaging/lysis transcriptional regulator n=1 Tax=Carnobacterium maltaromaticum TaxID=2751 RepID=UPI000C78B055|nr:ArpU family phage packaging/lysis transcriptional regulator [Carnobacterium maltaromaticum]PLS38280.1 transcriptional regulator [Carnobacterium maltaromaticum]PLS38657.1 transcriptional regulator [Carnobacterium maltaromaticum]PLS39034.1 transcriptional regulator [Carnobacterium maltaromaticum]PLS45304.1 transcriptional regulator [Carnobacterium maltaromaticum]PLS48159.1 transcriptional regulator [Carnobacterium maltaromaticum]
MVTLFDEINKEKTKIAVEEVLMQYRKLKMISKREIQKRMVDSHNHKSSEKQTDVTDRKISAKIYAEQETERIERAVESIPNEKQRLVIEERYLKGFEKYDSECSFNLDMPTSSYSNYKAAGLIAVAWALGCEEY